MRQKQKNQSNGKTILVVDDDRDIRETVMLVLELEGYSVACAENGQAALDFLLDALNNGEDLPSLILLDLMMPVMDAWQFRSRQRQVPGLKDLPVLIISAGGNVQQKAEHLGAAGWLRKPMTITGLVQGVGAALSPPDKRALRL